MTLQAPWAGKRGTALVLTLLLLTLLVVTGLELNRSVRVEASLAGNFRDLTQASFIAQSGVEIARALLKEDDLTYDGLDEKWAHFEMLSPLSQQLFPEGYFSGQIIDEAGKFNVNGLIDPFGNVDAKKKSQLERLLLLLRRNPDELVDAILDWLDVDETKRPQGAEREYYQSRKPPYAPKNGPLDSLGELLRIRGMDAGIFFGTEDREGVGRYLTIYSDRRININTASLPVLMSLAPGVDQNMAQALIARRQLKPLHRIEDLRLVPGWEAVLPQIRSEITVQSTCFSLEVVGHYREARAVVQAVLQREGRASRILYWKAG